MNTTENNLIFESYTVSLTEDQDIALKSNFKNILNVLEREQLQEPELFFNRAHTLINRLPSTNASKTKIIQHLKKALDTNGVEGMKQYLNTAAGFYEKGGFLSKTAAQADTVKFHDAGWNKPPTPEKLAMHYGDVVKYTGPRHPELNPNDTYMIVRKEVRGNKPVFFIKLYDDRTGDVVDKREFEKKIDNPNYLNQIGNNLKDQTKTYNRIGQGNIEQAREKSRMAQDPSKSTGIRSIR